MARGDTRSANAVSRQTGKKLQDYESDQIQVALCSDTFAAAANFNSLTQFTEVATGAGYTGPVDVAVTWDRTGSKSTLQVPDVSWVTDPGGPNDVRTAVVRNSAVGTSDVIVMVDLTVDGTTPIDMAVSPIIINFSLSATMEVDKI